MRVMVQDYRHRTGEHCASTALRNVLDFHHVEMSEAMVFGLAAGLGFIYLANDEISPTRMFHGRTLTLESDFFANTGIPFEDRPEPDDDRAWAAVRDQLDAGRPVLVSTDTFYLGYHQTTSHFPMHRAVVVGYDDETEEVFVADRKFETYQRCSFDELRRARNAPDYPMSCHNQYGDFLGPVRLGVPIEDAVRAALRQNASGMLTPANDDFPYRSGIDGMRRLAQDFASWSEIEDWSWAARFGYQVVIKRGAGGSFFRSLYADYLAEAQELVAAVGEAGLADEMRGIAGCWRDLAGVLKEQSERDRCDPDLFVTAGAITGRLADREQAFFERVEKIATA